MKTFEKWLDKSNYEFTIRNVDSVRKYLIKGSCGYCTVIVNPKTNRGSLVYDDNGYMRPCKNIKDTIELVDFLSGGVC